ncbi:caldesmon 1a isoform X1 [Kryptolebias marmoratus]|uniref:caldesmon 1a isoform X1 n=2 Tax=Kryptolebias marmoratus TaxID=37003 RepID=UPI000D530013|nr:caldesmon 1a isoform X1 [Kryptolebias marmoratus]
MSASRTFHQAGHRVFSFSFRQGSIMDDLDFERRRELRRQKREEMRLEAERMLRNDDDEEEAARERRRRERQERLRRRESEEPSSQPENQVVTNSHSVTESVSVSSSSSSYAGGGDDEDQALLDRMAKREERRQRRMKEALERQRQLEPDATEAAEEERPSSWRRGRSRDSLDEEEKAPAANSVKPEEPKEEEEAAPERKEEEEEQKVEAEENKLRRSNLREQELAEDDTVVSEGSNQARSANSQAEEAAVASGEDEEVPEDENVDKPTESEPLLLRHEEKCEVSEDNEVDERRGYKEDREDQWKHNGGLDEEAEPKQHRKPERTPSRGSVRSPEAAAGDEQDEDARLEAERKLEKLKRRRDDAESEEFERMRQKQQEAEAELEELKRKREERRKVLEEEERQRKQEEAEKKAREEEEKRKMKEEIEKRRAEAAEKRQKAEDTVDGEGKPFKCVSPRGSSLKIGERAEFLNKSAQKSAVKASHSPVVSKIDNRLEQYTSAAQRENKESRSPRGAISDLPLVTDVRNIKSMWEKGDVFSSPGSGGAFKEAAVIKTGVAGRINDWLNKTPEGGKTSGGRPADLKPVDVTNKRSLWENKGASPAKMADRAETKSVANGMGH